MLSWIPDTRLQFDIDSLRLDRHSTLTRL